MESILFTPAHVKALEIKNRLVRSATMEGLGTTEGRPTDALKDLYCRLADGEVGLVMTSGAMIETYPYYPDHFSQPLLMDDDSKIEGWPEVVDAVHERGAKLAMQIGYLGRQDVPEWRGGTPLAPSPVPVAATGVTPQEMTRQDIKDVVELFAQAVRRVKEAGFDAVQFHGAHGNLINNFMSPFTNIRTDEYGGTTQNRARFVAEIMERSRELVGSDFPVMIKMNFDDFIDGGLGLDDAVEIAGFIAEAGIDGIEVSGGTLSETPERVAVKGIAKPDREAYFRSHAQHLKEQVSLPVTLVGGLRSPEVITDILESGHADFISLSRPLIREPHLVKRWKEGNLRKSECVSCNQCFENWIFRPIRCYVTDPMEKRS